jgi:hypothetical protein
LASGKGKIRRTITKVHLEIKKYYAPSSPEEDIIGGYMNAEGIDLEIIMV